MDSNFGSEKIRKARISMLQNGESFKILNERWSPSPQLSISRISKHYIVLSGKSYSSFKAKQIDHASEHLEGWYPKGRITIDKDTLELCINLKFFHPYDIF